MQSVWYFRDRESKRILLECFADSRDELCKKAAKEYGRTPELWANHPYSEPVCVELHPLVSGTGDGVTIVEAGK